MGTAMISLRILAGAAACAVILAALSGQPEADAQTTCRTVPIEGVRGREVDLFDRSGAPAGTVSAADLGSITEAQDCGDRRFFVIRTADGERMVRRISLRQPATVQLPPCTCGTHGSGDVRNASSSGLGTASCAPNPACPGN
jgi:hypothetical protein